jgi:hypothetical protein
LRSLGALEAISREAWNASCANLLTPLIVPAVTVCECGVGGWGCHS